MKYLRLIILIPVFFGCKQGNKKLLFYNNESTITDVRYLNLSNSTINGSIKPIELNGVVYLSYKFSFFYDTSSNSKMDKTLFLGEPRFVGNYSENIDTLLKQIYKKTKEKVDSLQKVLDKKIYNKSKGGKKDSENMPQNGSNEELQLALEKGHLENRDLQKVFAENVLEWIKQAKELGTYPYFNYKAHFKSRTPAFSVAFRISLKDKEGFEITSYITDYHLIFPMKDNLIEGKITVGYASADKFQKEVLKKADKVYISISNSVQ
jgi:hypothetical protein